MPRPKKPRFVVGYPAISTFAPEDVPPSGECNLSMEAMEAVRLSDFEGLDQETAARSMDVSRQTYGRILSEARHIIAEALVTGKRLRIEGGHYKIAGGGGRHRRRRRGGRGTGGME